MMQDPIDAYLAELIGEATTVEIDPSLTASENPVTIETPPAAVVAAEALCATDTPPTQDDAIPAPATSLPDGPPAAARPDLWTAQLLAEMESDPQFGITPDEPSAMDDVTPVASVDRVNTDIVGKPEIWTELLLQELESDPQFARSTDGDLPVPAMASSADEPAVWTQALMDELADDPLFAEGTPSAVMPPPQGVVALNCNEDLLREMEADPLFAQPAPAPSPAPAPPAQTGSATATPAAAPTAPDTRPVPQPWLAAAQIEDNRSVAASPPVSRWLRLRCGEQPYALELLKVQEVGLPVPLLSLRGTPAHMLGIMNLRGQVVPVMDLGVFLGGMPAEETPASRIVVLESDGHTLGLRVSSVEDVVSLGAANIEPPDTVRLCRFSNHLFRGVARLGGPPMILLDADALLR